MSNANIISTFLLKNKPICTECQYLLFMSLLFRKNTNAFTSSRHSQKVTKMPFFALKAILSNAYI
jgi:hypothetical protein